jgi:hypothetical protein
MSSLYVAKRAFRHRHTWRNPDALGLGFQLQSNCSSPSNSVVFERGFEIWTCCSAGLPGTALFSKITNANLFVLLVHKWAGKMS